MRLRCQIAVLAVAVQIACCLSPVAAQTPGFADTLSKVDSLLDARRYAEAETITRTLLEQVRQSAATDPSQEVKEFADALHALAYARSGLGHPEEALTLLITVLEARIRVLGPNDLKVAQALNDQAFVLTTLGRYKDALPLHEQALTIREKAAPNGSAVVAQSLDNLVQVKRRIGDPRGVEQLLGRAAVIRTRVFGPVSAELADTLADLADVLVDEGREAEAAPLAERALAITEKALGAEDQEVARRLIKLGNVRRAAGDLAAAEASYRRALAIRETIFGAESRQAAGVLSNLANAILLQGKAAEAEPLLRRALELQIKVRGPDHPSVGETLSRLANALRDLGKRAEASPLYVQALAVQEKALGANHPEFVETLAGSAELAMLDGRIEDAFALIGQASEIVGKLDQLGERALVEDGVATRRQGQIHRRFTMIGFELAAQDPARAGALATATFEAAQRAIHSRTGVALQSLGARIGLADPALANLVRERQDLVERWRTSQKALIEALAKGSGQALAAEIAGIEADIAAVDARIAAEHSEFAELSAPEPMSVAEAQAQLGPDEALLLLLVNDDGVLIWTVTRDKVVWVGSGLGAAEISRRVAALRSGLDAQQKAGDVARGGAGAGLDITAAHDLYRQLLGASGGESAIADKRHLLLVPSGALTGLPFQLLVTDAPTDTSGPERFRRANWLIRKFAISVLPTISALRVLKARPAQGKGKLPFLGFADPVFKSGSASADGSQPPLRPTGGTETYFKGRHPDLLALSRGLAELPETADEVSEIGRLLGAGPDALVLRENASERTLKKMSTAGDLQRYSVVEFATHGLVAGEVEQMTRLRAEPALALTLPAEISLQDDGLLTASEAAELRLDADWIILSACNTAAGGRPGAEALSGLARSFFYAGARALLVSHWSVNSEAAVKLTTGTFARLNSGQTISRAEALRLTMLEVLDRDRDLENSDPRYWAPFSFVGHGGE